MSGWLMDNIWWFVAGLVVLIVGIKIAVILAFRRLSQATEEDGG